MTARHFLQDDLLRALWRTGRILRRAVNGCDQASVSDYLLMVFAAVEVRIQCCLVPLNAQFQQMAAHGAAPKFIVHLMPLWMFTTLFASAAACDDCH